MLLQLSEIIHHEIKLPRDFIKVIYTNGIVMLVYVLCNGHLMELFYCEKIPVFP